MKKSIWFKTDLGYQSSKRKIQFSLIIENWYGSKGRFTFFLKDYKDITFQITTKGNLGIYYPEVVSYQPFLEQIKPLLLTADGNPVKRIEKYFPPKPERKQTKQDNTTKRARAFTNQDRKLLRNHSRKLLYSKEIIPRKYKGEPTPEMILYVLIDNDPDLVEVSYLIQHVKTGYYEDIWSPLMEYLDVLKKCNLTDYEVPAMPTLKGVVREYFGDRWDKFRALPDEDKDKLRKLRIHLVKAIYDIILTVNHGFWLEGDCSKCLNLKKELAN